MLNTSLPQKQSNHDGRWEREQWTERYHPGLRAVNITQEKGRSPESTFLGLCYVRVLSKPGTGKE